ncbi:DUF2835 family protein [Exilibacterium tricleocarpae]|uniref:DUF2835 family protein n=1 Tax=Exilibacterium tricleocarpae TaxID=2591008 RepID=A0A545TV06_9GAMM|nr:DUF2835 domain-containing protein [Exilibacterium tricleocarpae]TQV80991.1 DUF2835 family protein [Exilibacterium tricleocarpae]
MASLIVDLAISAEEYQRLYRGAANAVVARARDGRRVRFPAHILRPFVTHTGIQGSFAITFDADNRYQAVERID